ncbi:unnamed protein product [Dracunculus medinensis]|uniref:Uncharacterized protein n=1 Tax=Dracunculus medinensis TaxID=318479 RepID=A0A0N4UNU6_DRAME|nr:unnamed protein product [Dracunculus medinensis]
MRVSRTKQPLQPHHSRLVNFYIKKHKEINGVIDITKQMHQTLGQQIIIYQSTINFALTEGQLLAYDGNDLGRTEHRITQSGKCVTNNNNSIIELSNCPYKRIVNTIISNFVTSLKPSLNLIAWMAILSSIWDQIRLNREIEGLKICYQL